MSNEVTSTENWSASPDGPRRRARVIIALVCLTLVGMGVVLFWTFRVGQQSLPPGVSYREQELARRTFLKHRGQQPDRFDLLFVLAESYLSGNRLLDAVACLAEIPTSHAEYGRLARYQQGRALLAMHRAVDAEKQARELIALEEAQPQLDHQLLINLRQGLRHILEVQLRFEERHVLLQGVIERGEATGFEILAGLFPSHLSWNGSQALRGIEEFHSADPKDPLIRIALGRYLTGRGSLSEARELLEKVARENPQDLRAKAALIACLREADAAEEVDRLMAELPPLSASEPWLLSIQRGIHAVEKGQASEATAAYELIIQTDPTSVQAWRGLTRATQLSKDTARRQHAIKMATGLGRIMNMLAKGLDRDSDPVFHLEIAEICAQLGLVREVQILSHFAQALAPDDERVKKVVQRIADSSKQPTTSSAAVGP